MTTTRGKPRRNMLRLLMEQNQLREAKERRGQPGRMGP